MYQIDPFFVQIAFYSSCAYFVMAIINFVLKTQDKRRIVGILIGAILIGLVVFAFDPFSVVQSFGPPPILLSLGMLTAIILGVISEYIFNVDREFKILEMLRPIVISPILLLPLVGLVNDSETYNTSSVISVLLVSFQNGFFWREIIKRAKNAL